MIYIKNVTLTVPGIIPESLPANGPWEHGEGSVCVNADSDVPSGQGNGKYGAHGTSPVTKNLYI